MALDGSRTEGHGNNETTETMERGTKSQIHKVTTVAKRHDSMRRHRRQRFSGLSNPPCDDAR
jgi:hypothetical protein